MLAPRHPHVKALLVPGWWVVGSSSSKSSEQNSSKLAAACYGVYGSICATVQFGSESYSPTPQAISKGWHLLSSALARVNSGALARLLVYVAAITHLADLTEFRGKRCS